MYSPMLRAHKRSVRVRHSTNSLVFTGDARLSRGHLTGAQPGAVCVMRQVGEITVWPENQPGSTGRGEATQVSSCSIKGVYRSPSKGAG